jgi:hypothetical protein
MSEEIDKNKFFEDIKNSHWTSDAIKKELEVSIEKKKSNVASLHEIRWNSDENYNFVYDNDCYMILKDRKIVVYCERENVFSSDLEVEKKVEIFYQVKEEFKKVQEYISQRIKANN